LATNFATLKHTQFEIGFIKNKQAWDYHYQTFVTPLLFQATTYEDTIDATRKHLRTNIGGLGIKFGGILPINEDEPLYFQLGIGLAKINVQKSPFWGQVSDSLLKTTRWALHPAFIYMTDQFLLRIEYTLSNKSFVDNQLLFALGINF
jgi:hypothetical protein